MTHSSEKPRRGGSSANQLVGISKFLSLVLRHQPDLIGLRLDEHGWTDVADLLACAARHGRSISSEQLHEVVRTSEKQRFAISEDGSRIRANQGHSIDVDLALPPSEPPEFLFHGTAEKSVASIRAVGIQKRSRTHVHLSADIETAVKVGARHGKPIVLRVRSGAMAAAGHTFYRSENGVWLVEVVPPEFLDEEPA